jgi:hypothetical protein
MSFATLHPGTPLDFPTEGALENFPSLEADVGALHWDEPRGLLTLDSPTLILTAVAPRPMPLLHSTQHFFDRALSLPVRWSLTPALDATTAEQRIQDSSDVFSSTDPLSRPSNFLVREVSVAFTAAAGEVFEEGVESQFSQALESLLKTHGTAAVAALEALVFPSTANPEVAVESLKWLGTADHGDSRQHRRRLLERLLHSANARIRYAAVLGIAAMDDGTSLPAVRSALKREPHRRLRQYFQLVVDQLEAVQ